MQCAGDPTPAAEGRLDQDRLDRDREVRGIFEGLLSLELHSEVKQMVQAAAVSLWSASSRCIVRTQKLCCKPLRLKTLHSLEWSM